MDASNKFDYIDKHYISQVEVRSRYPNLFGRRV
jgi:hypothetical protein